MEGVLYYIYLLGVLFVSLNDTLFTYLKSLFVDQYRHACADCTLADS
jgi:hypothetical protein